MGYSDKIRFLDGNRIGLVDENGKLLNQIKTIIKENSFKAREEDWTDDEMDERSLYDAYKVIKTVEDFLR